MEQVQGKRVEVESLVAAWKRWAGVSTTKDDGWEKGFPQWAELVASAQAWLETPDAADEGAATLIAELIRIDAYWEELDECFRANTARLHAPLNKLFNDNEGLPSLRAFRYLAINGYSTGDLRDIVMSDAPDEYRSTAFGLICERLPRAERIELARKIIGMEASSLLRIPAMNVLQENGLW